jgi:serine/threonine protein kinase
VPPFDDSDTTGFRTGKGDEEQIPDPELLVPRIPGYEIVNVLGKGGMGVVYKARQLSLDRLVALKILPSELIERDGSFAARFEREARLMAGLSHPAIVPVHDFGITEGGQLYFSMGLIDGSDVAEQIRPNGKLPAHTALEIAATVCEALAFALGAALDGGDLGARPDADGWPLVSLRDRYRSADEGAR